MPSAIGDGQMTLGSRVEVAHIDEPLAVGNRAIYWPRSSLSAGLIFQGGRINSPVPRI